MPNDGRPNYRKYDPQEVANITLQEDLGVKKIAPYGWTGAAAVQLAVDSQGRLRIDPTSLSTVVPTTRTLTLNGTTNQITVSPTGAQDLSADRTWTLSTPQNIHTGATPTFAGLTVNGTSSSLVAEVTGFNAVNAGRFIIDSTDGSTVGAIYASNDTNFAHSGYIARLETKNGTDSGPVLSLVNAGTGNYITADAVFSVSKAGLTTTQSLSIGSLSGALSASLGTVSAGTLSVAFGGTGITSLTANRIPYGNGSSAFQSSANLSFDGTTFMVGSANTNSAIFSAERSITSGSIRTANILLTITGANANFPVANRVRVDLNTGIGGTQNVVTASDQSIIWNAGMVADVGTVFALNMDVGYNGSGGVSGAAIGLRTAIAINSASSGSIANVVGWQSNFTHAGTTTISNVRLINFVANGIQYTGGTITNYMYIDIESPSALSSTTVTNMYGIRIRAMNLGTARYAIYFDGTGTTNGIYWGTTTLLYSSGAGTINVTGIFAASSNITSGGSIAATTGVSGTTGTFSTSVTTPLVSPSGADLVVRGQDATNGTNITVRGGDSNSMAGNGGNFTIELGSQGTVSGTPGNFKVFESDGTTEMMGFTQDTGVVFNETGQSNLDFRVEGDTNTNLIFADASADAVGIGTGSPGSMLDVADDVRARQLIADGSSAGTASTNTFTNGTDGVSAGTISVFDSTATGLVHQGYIRVFVGTTEAWVPYMVSAG